ncbi:MAG: hypothetical protein R6U04_03960 [Bacteroidales bacterium]
MLERGVFGTRMTRIELMTADYFNCLVVELFSCLEDDGSYYLETITAAISPCLVPLPLQLFSLRTVAPSLFRFVVPSRLHSAHLLIAQSRRQASIISILVFISDYPCLPAGRRVLYLTEQRSISFIVALLAKK